MSVPIKTNKITYSIEKESLFSKYDVFRICTTDKCFNRGAYIIDAPLLNNGVCSVLFQSGREFFVLMRKNQNNLSNLKATIVDAEGFEHITISQMQSNEVNDVVILQLLLNSLGSYNSSFLSFNNLTGHLYCFHPNWLVRSRKIENNAILKVPCLELKLSSDFHLKMEVHTFTSELLRNNIEFKKKRFEEYPKYVFSAHNTLRRRLESDTEKSFIMRQTRNAKTEIPFLDIQNIERFNQSKMGILALIIDTFNENFASIANINFGDISQYESLDYTRTVANENKNTISKLLTDTPIKIVDCIDDEYSKIFCNEIMQLLLIKYNVKAKCGKRIDKECLNIRVIHNAAYYTNCEDEYRIFDDIAVQHISDIVPMQDLFNEWHAKNTSDKVRRVMQSKGMSGKPLTTNPPFGYMKSPDDKDEWLVDEPAAKVVKRIFDFCVSGFGPTQIAKRLRAEKVLTPTEYWNSIGRKCSKPPAIPYGWVADTVSNILDKQEYCGDTVNFRYTSKSFKLKKRFERPQEEWQIFENTHPAIIDRETFELVQELRKHRRRPAKSGIVSMFSGLLYCADCGEKLYYSVTGNYKREQANFFCSSYRKNSNVCSAHYIREKVVESLVLESMQRVLWYVQTYEKLFAQRQLEEFGEKHKKELAEKRRELDKAKVRVREIDGVIQKLYEDNATGKVSDERFATMSISLENEQGELKERIPILEEELETAKIKTEGLQRFIDKAKQITRLEALTPELVHEFIEKIVVSAPDYKDGKRYQEVEIHYNSVGIIREPTAEEMEEHFQEHIKKKPHLTAKTA